MNINIHVKGEGQWKKSSFSFLSLKIDSFLIQYIPEEDFRSPQMWGSRAGHPQAGQGTPKLDRAALSSVLCLEC